MQNGNYIERGCRFYDISGYRRGWGSQDYLRKRHIGAKNIKKKIYII